MEQQLKEQHITKTIGLDSIAIYPILLTQRMDKISMENSYSVYIESALKTIKIGCHNYI